MTQHILNQQDEIFGLYDKSTRLFYDLLNKIAIATWQNDIGKQTSLTQKLSNLLASTRAYADLLGRRRILLRIKDKEYFRDTTATNPIIPRIPFQEAIDDLVKRLPVLARSAEEIKQIYTTEHSFVIARSTSLNLTKRIQKEIASAMEEGKTIRNASDLISRISDWNYAYSETIYRTTLNTSYHAGQFQIMKQPEVKAIVPAFRFVAVLDSDVRANHKAMHNVIANADADIWQRLCPPLGFLCRCTLVTMDWITLKRMGINPERIPEPRIPAGAYPDSPGFGRNPAMDIYGV